jgi:hypothetical protein
MEIQTHEGIGKAYCSVSDSSGVTVSVRGNTNVADGQPHTITCEKTATSLTLLVDSLTPRVKNATIGSISDTKPLLLGVKAVNAGSSGDWYNGTMLGATISVSQ